MILIPIREEYIKEKTFVAFTPVPPDHKMLSVTLDYTRVGITQIEGAASGHLKILNLIMRLVVDCAFCAAVLSGEIFACKSMEREVGRYLGQFDFGLGWFRFIDWGHTEDGNGFLSHEQNIACSITPREKLSSGSSIR